MPQHPHPPHPPIEPQAHHLESEDRDTSPAKMNPRERRISGPVMLLLLFLGIILVAVGIYFSTRI